MHNQLPALLPCLLVASLGAQGVTSPKGYDTTEGNAIFYHWNGTRRIQNIDNTHSASVFLVKSIGFRRDASGGGAGSVPRTINASVDMGLASWGICSTNMDDNFLPATKVTVFTKKAVTMPDWTAVPGTPPAAFDFVMLYDTPWLYTGTNALIWSVSYDGGPSAQAQTDRHYVAITPTAGAGTIVGAGCTATGMASPFTHTLTLNNGGPSIGMALTSAAAFAPANTPVSLFLDGVNSNLSIPGVCSALYALPTVQLPIGTSSATGAVASMIFQVPYNVFLQGGTIYTQCLALDAGQAGFPIALSNGRSATMPAGPAAGIQCIYQWSTLPTITGALQYGGGLIAWLGF